MPANKLHRDDTEELVERHDFFFDVGFFCFDYAFCHLNCCLFRLNWTVM